MLVLGVEEVCAEEEVLYCGSRPMGFEFRGGGGCPRVGGALSGLVLAKNEGKRSSHGKEGERFD